MGSVHGAQIGRSHSETQRFEAVEKKAAHCRAMRYAHAKHYKLIAVSLSLLLLAAPPLPLPLPMLLLDVAFPLWR